MIIGTLVVASSEENGASFIANKALGDAGGSLLLQRRPTKRSRISRLLVHHGVGFHDLDRERMTVSPWFQLIHFHKHRFS